MSHIQLKITYHIPNSGGVRILDWGIREFLDPQTSPPDRDMYVRFSNLLHTIWRLYFLKKHVIWTSYCQNEHFFYHLKQQICLLPLLNTFSLFLLCVYSLKIRSFSLPCPKPYLVPNVLIQILRDSRILLKKLRDSAESLESC